MSNFLCDCGCKLFGEFKPFTIDESAFMVWNFKEKLIPNKVSVPVIQCVSCGKLYPPKSSFQGKNMLDEEVQLYSELLKYIANRNSIIDKTTRVQVVSVFSTNGSDQSGTIKTSSDSKESIENAIDPVSAGNRSGKFSKKQTV